MMTATIDQFVGIAAKSSAPMRQYRFVFELGNGVSFGGDFECVARSEGDAWRILDGAMPGAKDHVKKLVANPPTMN